MAGLGASVSVQLVTDFSETEHNTLNKTFRIKSKVNSLSSFSRRMTGLYSQTKILWSADVDWWHKDTKWPQSGQATRGNLLTLTRCHPTVLCGIFPWLAKGIILFRSNSSRLYVWLGILSWCLFTFVRFPTKTVWSPLSFSGEVSTFLWILKGQTYKNSFVRLFWSTLQFFLRRKTSQSSPLDLKLDEMAKQGLDWKDNKILTNTKHDQGRTETVQFIKYKTHLVRI